MHDTTTIHPDFEGLYLVATGQMGHFTSAQAKEHGISRMLLHYHVKTGRLQRIYRGVYRFRDFPSSPREEVAAAWLAVGKDIAVVSHESALEVLGLSDIIPHKIELTIPRDQRYRKPPEGITVHTSIHPIQREDIVYRDGLPTTSPARTIVDVTESGTSLEHVEVAVEQALNQGTTSVRRLRDHSSGRSLRVRDAISDAIEQVAS